jgi:hypothetical protein
MSILGYGVIMNKYTIVDNVDKSEGFEGSEGLL